MKTYSFIILAHTHICMPICQYILTCIYGCGWEFWMSVFTWIYLPFASVRLRSITMVITIISNLESLIIANLTLSLNYPTLVYNCTPKWCGRLKSRLTRLLTNALEFICPTVINNRDHASETNGKEAGVTSNVCTFRLYMKTAFLYKLYTHVFSSYIFFNM